MAQAYTKEQAIVQYGPYGSKAPENYRWHLLENEHIIEVIINHENLLDAIGFRVSRPDGSTYHVRFGGNTPNPSRIVLKSGEYLTGVGGTYGHVWQRKKVCIATMKIYTNLCPQGYGPYGLAKHVDNITNFESPLQYGFPLVGVLGAQDGVLESIGVLLMERKVIVQYGPYGSLSPENYRWQLSDGERFTEVIINHGNVVDAIGFRIVKPSGTTHIVRFGGNTPNPSRIILKSGEYPTGFTGQSGYYSDQQQLVIATIKVFTNLCPQGYGPFGLAEDVDNISDFESPLQYGFPLAGVFGACDNNLESIGVLLMKIQESS